MRDSKSIILLVFALVVITIAFVLISIWGYRFYFQKGSSKPLVTIVSRPDSPNNIHQNDSLVTYQKYTNGLNNGKDTPAIKTDTSVANLGAKIAEFEKLKGEISGIIDKKIVETDDSISAQKIATLQKSIDILQNKNNKVTEENLRLNALLRQLASAQNQKKKAQKEFVKGNSVNDNPINNSLLSVSNLNLSAIAMEENKENETFKASLTNKLKGSFILKSKEGTSGEIDVVIIQPNGKVLQNSAWESGVFITPSGKKIYSAKLNFNGKNNHLNFSITADKFQKGTYTVQVYYKGIVIARAMKTLS
jgi:curved DNA-binding protein CbpA